jgi:hypothetical protein
MSEMVSLREYVDVRFDAQQEAVHAALTSAKEAVVKAEMATERRFENSNEWRNTVETLQRTYMPRTEALQQNTSMTEKIESVQKIVWTGLGVVLAFQIFIGIAVMMWKRS